MPPNNNEQFCSHEDKSSPPDLKVADVFIQWNPAIACLTASDWWASCVCTVRCSNITVSSAPDISVMSVFPERPMTDSSIIYFVTHVFILLQGSQRATIRWAMLYWWGREENQNYSQFNSSLLCLVWVTVRLKKGHLFKR